MAIYDSGKTLEVNQRVTSQSEADRLAKNKLKQANKDANKASLKVMGNPMYLAGQNVTLTGFGKPDGKYAIDKATHSISASGYTTSLELRKISP